MANETRFFSQGEGRLLVTGVCMWAGADAVVVLTGGEKPHVGAVAVAHPSETADGGGKTATACVMCLPGHKEDVLAREAALRLAKAADVSVSVTAGIHVGSASDEDISKLLMNAQDVVCHIEQWITKMDN